MFQRVIKTESETYLNNFPYFSQRDNKLNPSGACNVSSIAMGLHWLGIRGTGNGQLEDQMYRRCLDRGFSRHNPIGLKKLVESYGCKDDYLEHGTIEDIREAIDKGQPCVIHTFLTNFGHIVAISGYSKNSFRVQDPWGEWSIGGYIKKSGKDLEYSDSLIASSSSAWSHEEFLELYRKRSLKSNMYLHRLSLLDTL